MGSQYLNKWQGFFGERNTNLGDQGGKRIKFWRIKGEYEELKMGRVYKKYTLIKGSHSPKDPGTKQAGINLTGAQ